MLGESINPEYYLGLLAADGMLSLDIGSDPEAAFLVTGSAEKLHLLSQQPELEFSSV